MTMRAGEAVFDGRDRLPLPSAGRLEVSLGQYSTAGAKSENQDFHGALEPEGADRATKGIAVTIADGIILEIDGIRDPHRARQLAADVVRQMHP